MAKEPSSSEKPAASDAAAAPAAESQLDSVLKEQVAREVQEAFAAKGDAAKSTGEAPKPASDVTVPAAAATPASAPAAADPNAESDDAEIQRILMEEVGSLAEAAGMATAPREEGQAAPADFGAAEAEIAAAEAARSAATAEKQSADPPADSVAAASEAAPEASAAAAATAAAEGVLSEAPPASAAPPAPAESSATSEPQPSPVEAPSTASLPETPEQAVKAVAGAAEVDAPPPAKEKASSRIAEDVKAKAGGDEKVAVTQAAAGALAEAAGDRLPKDKKGQEAVGGDERRALKEGDKAPAESPASAGPPKKFSPRWLMATLWSLATKVFGTLRPLTGKLLTAVLDPINRPFASLLDDDSRDILGKVAILTLLAAVALFILGLCK
jgi:hypothetical protein